jgi:hypothetical protein
MGNGADGMLLEATGNLRAFSPVERVALKKNTRINVAPSAFLLILLAMLTLLAVYKGLTPDKAERAVVQLEDNAVHDSYAPVAIVATVAVFAYVVWTGLRGNQGDVKAMPPAKESSANDRLAPG